MKKIFIILLTIFSINIVSAFEIDIEKIEIGNKANELIETLDKVISEKERKIMEKEENISDLIREMAAVILKENANHIGIEEVEESIQLLEKEQEEATKEKKGGKKNGYTSSKNSRGRSSSRTIK